MSLVLSEGLNPAIDRVVLDRAEYERLRSINAELLAALIAMESAAFADSKRPEVLQARAAIERAKA